MSKSGENIDTDLYDSKADAIQAALDTSDIGDTLIICRGDWAKCADGQICPMCARVTVTEDMTADDALAAARAYSA